MKKGAGRLETVPRSIRFPPPVWRQLEHLAKAEELTLHAAMRQAALEWMRREGAARRPQ
jgi:predicted transcriptional regulator